MSNEVRRTPLLPAVRSVGALCDAALAAGLAGPIRAELHEFFGTGTYVRSLVIAPGSVLEGQTHRHSTILVVLSGSIDIILSHGERRHLPQGSITVAPPMTRRAVATREGATVLTVHHTADIDTTAPDAPGRLRDLLIAEETP